MVEVPSTTDAASPAFVTSALRASGTLPSNAEVTEVEHTEIGVGVGIVGQLARLGLTVEGDGADDLPGSMVLKIPSHLPQNRAVADHFNFYEREGRFYEQIGGKLAVRTPRCHWNHIDTESGSFGLLLEDLSGCSMVSQVEGLSPDRAAQALAALAELHGTWWASPSLDGLGWMPRLDDPVNLAAGQQYRDSWPVFLERVGDLLPEGAIELGERTKERFEDLLRAGIAEAPSTICHGDFRVDNLMFDDAATGLDTVAVLDWQISYRGPAVTDVAYLLCQSMTIDARRANEADLVRGWYEGIAAALGEAPGTYPFDLAWEQYRRAVLGTTVYAVTSVGSMDPANERGRELVTAMTLRSFTAALDLDSVALLV
jgi:aminoglycoside phosphotransferase (APT) family kinase protein